MYIPYVRRVILDRDKNFLEFVYKEVAFNKESINFLSSLFPSCVLISLGRIISRDLSLLKIAPASELF